jgi:hypothetical protein
MTIYIGDIFEAAKFNDGFWQGSKKYENTFLDSHYYHGEFALSHALVWEDYFWPFCSKRFVLGKPAVFSQNPRHLSPRGHIGMFMKYWKHDGFKAVVSLLEFFYVTTFGE